MCILKRAISDGLYFNFFKQPKPLHCSLYGCYLQEGCVMLLNSPNTAGQWDDVSCDGERAFICMRYKGRWCIPKYAICGCSVSARSEPCQNANNNMLMYKDDCPLRFKHQCWYTKTWAEMWPAFWNTAYPYLSLFSAFKDQNICLTFNFLPQKYHLSNSLLFSFKIPTCKLWGCLEPPAMKRYVVIRTWPTGKAQATVTK